MNFICENDKSSDIFCNLEIESETDSCFVNKILYKSEKFFRN